MKRRLNSRINRWAVVSRLTVARKMTVAGVLAVVMMACVLVVACVDVQKEDEERATKERLLHDTMLTGFGSPDSLQKQYELMVEQKDLHGQASVLRKMARSYFGLGELERSLEMDQKALELSKEMNDTIELIESNISIGRGYRRLTHFDLALGYYYEAQDMVNRSLNKADCFYDYEQAKIDYGMASVLTEIQHYETADSAYRAALKHFERCKYHSGAIECMNGMAELLERTGQLDSAEYYSCQAYAMSKRYGYVKGQVESLIGMGGHNLQKGVTDVGEHQRLEAYRLAMNTSDVWLRLEAKIAKAETSLYKGELEGVEDQILEVQNEAMRIRAHGYLARINALFYRYYTMKNDDRNALRCFVNYKNYQDSVADLTLMNQLGELRTRHISNKMEMEQQTMMLQLEKNRIALVALLVIAILVGMVALGLVHILRQRRKIEMLTSQIQKSREAFFVNVSHEFRTPLTLIMGYAEELVKETKLSTNQVRNIGETISRQGASLLRMVNQLLDIIRSSGPVNKAEWRHGDVVSFVGMIVESFHVFAGMKSQNLRFVPLGDELEMDFVPEYMEKIVRNLVSNSMKFTPVNGIITVRTSDDGKGNLVLSVSDNGTGIDQDDLHRLFEPFFQTDAKNKEMGSGLGLPLVQQLVKEMKGKIDVESELGSGSTFTITLPLKHEGDPVLPMDKYVEAMPEEPSLCGREEACELVDDSGYATNILIVEDNIEVANYLGHLLSHQYGVMFATNGESALEKAKESIPSLIITDVVMPGMDGYELCAQVRANELLNHIPLIILTAKTETDDRIRSFDVGADAYVAKPFKAEELMTKINHLLAQRKLLQEKFTRYVMNQELPSAPKDSADCKLMDHLTDLVYEQMNEGEVDVESVAKKMNMSMSQFRRKVMAVTGEAPIQYISRIRMIYAKRLLERDEDLKVFEVGLKCGYNDNAYFSRTFKQFYGMSPSEFRKGLRR